MATSIRRTTTTVQTARRCVVSKHQSGSDGEDSLLTDLFAAYYRARKNKRNTYSQLKFEKNLSDNLISLYDDIRTRRYKVGRSMCFVIKDPVLREVFAASFRDRIVHHLIYNWLSPIFERNFIYDSYSCREAKGNLFGVKRLEHHIRSCSNNYTSECYVLKLDIRSYFMDINRKKLYDIISSGLMSYAATHSLKFDLSLAMWLLALIIFNDPTRGCMRKGDRRLWDALPRSKSLFYAAQGCGLPIGNLTSQLFSNIYLSSFDDYVKRELGFQHYGRYVDDFFLVSTSKSRLLSVIPDIRAYLDRELGLTLHPNKVALLDVCRGVRFLGRVTRPYHTYIHPDVLRRMKVKLNDAFLSPNPYYILAVASSLKAITSKH